MPEKNIKPETLTADIKQELMLRRVAQTNNFSVVAREFGTNPMRVSRLWKALSKEQQDAYRQEIKQTSLVVRDHLAESDISFAAKYKKDIQESLDLAATELLRRLTDNAKQIADKNLLSAIRVLNNIISDNKPDPENVKEDTNIFNILDKSISTNLTISTTDKNDNRNE